MVKAMIDIQERTNRVLNIIKAKYNLTDKSDAIDIMAAEYEEQILERPLRPGFVKKLSQLKKQKGIIFKSVGELRKHLENAQFRD